MDTNITLNEFLLLIGEKEVLNFQLRRENAQLRQACQALIAELDALKQSLASTNGGK